MQDTSTMACSSLLSAEAQFRQCLERLPVAAYTCDADGLITFYNAAASGMWGRKPRLNDPDDRFCGSLRLFTRDGKPIAPCDCWMALTLREKREHVGRDIVIERADGSRINVLAHASPLLDERGGLLGAVNVLVDITERHRTEEAIREAHEAAETLNRAKDRFLATLSHELRTPLSPVVMTLAAMESDPELPERFREDVTLMRRNIELESKLIDDLLDISGAINGKLRLNKRHVSLHAKLQNVLKNSLSDIYRKRLHISTDLQATNDCVLADAARIQQVLWNVLRNATKFTPDGGSILARTWNETDGTELCIEVKDSGMGIAPEVLPTLFNPFEQGEESVTSQFGGMGLGLAIARSIVEMHGGSISVSSEGRGKGATFLIRLGVVKGYCGESHPVESPVAAPLRKARVLVVEDHADTAIVLQRILEKTGYEVWVATSAAAAMQLVSRHRFDVLISDIGLPDANGYQLLADIQRQSPIRAIAMSGYGLEEDLQRSRAAGFADHLVKPVHPSQLQAVIARVLGFQDEMQ